MRINGQRLARPSHLSSPGPKRKKTTDFRKEKLDGARTVLTCLILTKRSQTHLTFSQRLTSSSRFRNDLDNLPKIISESDHSIRSSSKEYLRSDCYIVPESALNLLFLGIFIIKVVL